MQIYYINLDRSSERRVFMEGQFGRLGLSATRIEATAEASLTKEQLARHCDPRHGAWVMPRELCCTLSHIRTLEIFLASTARYALILEDDALLSRSLPRFLSAYESENERFDFCRIETSLEPVRRIDGRDPDIAGVAISRVFSQSAGTAAYVVSRRAAERLAASPLLLVKPLDNVLGDPYNPVFRGLTVRHADPGLAIQTRLLEAGEGPSLATEIGGRRKRAEMERPHFWRRLPHIVASALERDVVIGVRRTFHRYVDGARRKRIPFRPD